MKGWKELKLEIDRATAETLLKPDQEVLAVFKYRMSRGGAGVPVDNQIFTTWFFGGADVNYLCDWCSFLLDLIVDESFSLEKIRQITRYWIIQPSEFGHYCGLRRQYEFTTDLIAMLDTLDRNELWSVLDSFRAYFANINAWVFQYFPWGLGYAFPRKDEEYFKKGLELLN